MSGKPGRKLDGVLHKVLHFLTLGSKALTDLDAGAAAVEILGAVGVSGIKRGVFQGGSGSENFHAATCSGGGSKIGSKQEHRSIGSKSSDSKKFVTRSLSIYFCVQLPERTNHRSFPANGRSGHSENVDKVSIRYGVSVQFSGGYPIICVNLLRGVE